MHSRTLLFGFALTVSASSVWAQKNVPPPPAGAAAQKIPIDAQLMNVIDSYCMLSLVEQKLVDGADPNYKNEDASLKIKVGDNALVAALRRRCDEKVIKRLVKGEVPVNINKMSVKKADVEAVGADGITPLVLAVRIGDVSMVKMILEAGADPNRKMVSVDTALNGKTAFDFIEGKSNEKRLRRVLKKERD